MTPKIILFEVGTPTVLFDSTPQINIVKIASQPEAIFVFTMFVSFLLKGEIRTKT